MSMQQKLWRIVDANFNRSKEAMRVAEDFARFFMNDKKMAVHFKKNRHRLTQILLQFPISYQKLVMARNARQDVGKNQSIQDAPKNWRNIMISNLKRGEESVRVLEELSKLIAPRQTKHFEKIRFELYELEKRSLQKF